MDSTTTKLFPNNANRKVLRLLGRAYLRESRIEDALEVYQNLLRDDPNDSDVLVILGNLYCAAGSPGTAARLYRRVLDRNPGHTLAEKRTIEVSAEPRNGWEELQPLDAQAVSRLVDRLRGEQAPARVEEIRCAADKVEKIVTEDRVGEANGQADDLQQLMPALIGLSIRQARAAGRPDLAEALQSLQINLTRQIDDRWVDDLLNGENPLQAPF